MILDKIEPVRVMKYFEDICSIPHGSRDTDKISQYCMDFAKSHGLEAKRDAHNNVIIKKPKTGMSNRTVIIQGHLDMVCAKDADCDIDFATDGLRLMTDNSYIWADGTTLGGDDGIAVAMALAVLEAEDITHPALECVFTTDEEIGMPGAEALDMSELNGSLLLNIDSEEEGIFTVSCAGGATVTAELNTAPAGGRFTDAVKITVDGLMGGHSGTEIDKGRANACIVLGNILAALKKQTEFALISINGGEKDNAIPRRAEAVIAVNDYVKVSFTIAAVNQLYREIQRENDPGINITAERTENCGVPIKSDIIRLLTAVPNGVRRMSEDIEGLVKTSSNLGILRTENDKITVTFSVRSSASEEKAELINVISGLVNSCGGKACISGEYPAWEYNQNSVLREACAGVYRDQYGEEPQISAIHAGLECGIFCGKKPELDCISFGPNILDIHTPQERLDIKSTERVYKFLIKLLERL